MLLQPDPARDQALQVNLVRAETEFGPEHERTAQAAMRLALRYLATDRFAESEALYARALSLFQNLYGEAYPACGFALRGLGQCCEAQERVAEAEQHYKEALRIDETTLGPGHPETNVVISSLVSLYKRTGRTVEADKYRKHFLTGVNFGILVEGPDNTLIEVTPE